MNDVSCQLKCTNVCVYMNKKPGYA